MLQIKLYHINKDTISIYNELVGLKASEVYWWGAMDYRSN